MTFRPGGLLHLVLAVLADSLVAQAQPGKAPRIGVLLCAAAPAPALVARADRVIE
jgi:hypothetical protein